MILGVPSFRKPPFMVYSEYIYIHTKYVKSLYEIDHVRFCLGDSKTCWKPWWMYYEGDFTCEKKQTNWMEPMGWCHAFCGAPIFALCLLPQTEPPCDKIKPTNQEMCCLKWKQIEKLKHVQLIRRPRPSVGGRAPEENHRSSSGTTSFMPSTVANFASSF